MVVTKSEGKSDWHGRKQISQYQQAYEDMCFL